jgi:hypothetical protein
MTKTPEPRPPNPDPQTPQPRPVGDAYWFVALLGLLPAVRADLLLPHTWPGRLDERYSLGIIENPFGIGALAIACLAWWLAHRLQARRFLLAVLPFLLITLAASPVGQQFDGINSVYIASAVAVGVLFILQGQVMSVHFALFASMLLALWRLDDALSLSASALCLLTLVVARLAVESVRQNLPLARELGRSNMRALVTKTLALWWPMLLLIGVGLYLGSRLSESGEASLYASGAVIPYCKLNSPDGETVLVCPPDNARLLPEQITEVAPSELSTGTLCAYVSPLPFPEDPSFRAERFSCPPDRDTVADWEVTRLDVFSNIDRTVARTYQAQRLQLTAALASVDDKVEDVPDVAEREARRLFAVVPASTGMRTSRCNFPYVACAAKNLVIEELNRAYRKSRARSERKFVAHMRGLGSDLEDKTQGYWLPEARAQLDVRMNDAESATSNAIARFRTASHATQQLMLLWLIVIAIKSILYVFARVVFDRSTDIEVDLLEVDGTPAQGSVRQRQEINISADYAQDIYYKANYQPLGPAPRFSIPQWRASLLSRLRYGAWNMSHVAMPLPEGSSLTFNSVEAEHLVDWEMAEGEEVVFSYRNFVAMNAHVELRTVISLRVATLLMGRMIFHTARCRGGPGRLILRTRGRPATAEQVQQSIPAARLVAWNRYARFSVDSHLTPTDIFFNGFNLRRSVALDQGQPQGILIVEADARDGGILVGTLRFARTFLMPV